MLPVEDVEPVVIVEDGGTPMKLKFNHNIK